MCTEIRASLLIVSAVLSLLPAASAHAASHLWRFNEIFSNADGSIMFIELKECCGAANEVFIVNKWVKSDATGEIFTFPANLPCNNCTANQYLLLATQSFADLPGAPAPDYIIEPNFFSLQGDTLRYWLYGGKAIFSFAGGEVPVDGIHSLSYTGTVEANSPTNFAGDTGSITAACNAADIAADGSVNIDDLLSVIDDWGPCADPDYCPADCAPPGGDDQVNIDDLLAVINAWGACP
jgi:hypothetical protein